MKPASLHASPWLESLAERLEVHAGNLLRGTADPVSAAGTCSLASIEVRRLHDQLQNLRASVVAAPGPEEAGPDEAGPDDPPAPAPRAAECRHVWEAPPADAPPDWRPRCTKEGCGKVKGRRSPGGAP
jgi:hypothetical protein